jgi:pyruvate/2-oxoacid:ferredoxin oxidoreductase alpha subunit
LDSVIMAFKLAEQVLLPVMLTYDAFFLSHTSEIVDIPDIEDVDRFLPAYEPEFKLDVNNPRMFGGITMPDWFYEGRYVMHRDTLGALSAYPQVCGEFGEQFGRHYDLVEEYRTEETDLIVVTAGTVTSVTRLVVDQLREEGQKVGLMKVRMLRPAPAETWRSVLGGMKKVLVIDRNMIPGMGGVFAQEIRAALYPLDRRPDIYQAVVGLGGRDVTPSDIRGIVDHALTREHPDDAPLFWGLKH